MAFFGVPIDGKRGCASAGRIVLATLVTVVASACVRVPARRIDPAPAAATIRQSVFLLGDAGDRDPALGPEPVFVALRSALLASGPAATVVFLGDNIYPSGLPPEGAPGRAVAEGRLDAQIAAGQGTGARVIFVPGNHDWRYEVGGDPEAVRRQQRYVLERGGASFDWLPRDACPGPVVRDIGAALRLVALDTEWFLSRTYGLRDPGEQCAFRTRADVLDGLGRAIENADGRVTIVVAHHPLESGGVHGGSFTALDHLFPLRRVHGALWLPLPLIGSLYPLVRSWGVSRQDLGSRAYRALRASLDSVFAVHPPFAFAAGHEHNLQVLESEAVRRLIVSGAGNLDHVDDVRPLGSTLYAVAKAGYVRADVLDDGSVSLSVIIVAADGSGVVAFRERIQP